MLRCIYEVTEEISPASEPYKNWTFDTKKWKPSLADQLLDNSLAASGLWVKIKAMWRYLLVNPILCAAHFKHLSTRVDWRESLDAEYPFQASVKGEIWQLRINDFPREPMFTLLVGGRKICDLDDAPPTWVFPKI